MRHRTPLTAAIRWTVRVWILCLGAALVVRLATAAAVDDGTWIGAAAPDFPLESVQQLP